MTETVSSRFGWRSWLAFGIALAILLGLGTWQLQRRTWKEGVLADIAARGAATPMSALPVDCRTCEYQRISVLGRFVPNSERHVFISVPKQANGIGGPGYWVFALFDTGFDTGAQRVYVNRGFVPETEKAAKRETSSEQIRIDGVVRLPEPRGRFSNANSPDKNVFYVRSPTEFDSGPIANPARDVRRDLYIDLTGPVPAVGLPLPMVGKIAIPNRHLEYALTWYALALTLVGVVLAMARRAR